MQVRPGNLLNEGRSVLRVVPQGGVLRPMLMNLAMAELPGALNESRRPVKMYTCMLTTYAPGYLNTIASAMQRPTVFRRRPRHSNGFYKIRRNVAATTDKPWSIVVEQVLTIFYRLFF